MKHGESRSTEAAAAKAGFSARSGCRINQDPTLPSRKKAPRGRRRPDPLAGMFEEEVVPMLEADPGIRAFGVFEEPMRRRPDPDPGVRRTLERRIRDWRACHGPDWEAVFRQTREPGRLGLSEFANMNAPGAAIAGQQPARMLHRFRLPWSGFRHAEAGPGGESFTAPAPGLQAALRSPGGAPGERRTDSLSAEFRNRCTDDAEDMTERCLLPCRRCGTTPPRNSRGIARGNGVIESPHGHLEREIAGAPALRGSADFADAAACRAFIAGIVGRGNARRSGRIRAERATLRDLPPMRTTDCEETGIDAASSRGFILKRASCTVPSQLIGRRLGVRPCDGRLKLHAGAVRRSSLPRRAVPARGLPPLLRDGVVGGGRTRCLPTDGEAPRPAHEEYCEAAPAAEIDGCLAAGMLPDLDSLGTRFAPEPGAMPEVRVMRAPLAGHGCASCDAGRRRTACVG